MTTIFAVDGYNNLMSNAQNFIKSWHDNLHVQNVDFLEEILDDNVVFYSPVVFKPIQGKEMTKLYLASAGFFQYGKF